MTMPHLMNCPHSADAWCLECVKKLNDECEQLRELVEFSFHEPTHMNKDGYPMIISEEDEAWRCSESKRRLDKIFAIE